MWQRTKGGPLIFNTKKKSVMKIQAKDPISTAIIVVAQVVFIYSLAFLAILLAL
jgi:hypothetical protein